MPFPCSEIFYGSSTLFSLTPKAAYTLNSMNSSGLISHPLGLAFNELLAVPKHTFCMHFLLPSLPGKLLPILHSPVHLSLLETSLEAPFPIHKLVAQPPLWKCFLSTWSSLYHSNELGSNHDYCVPSP